MTINLVYFTQFLAKRDYVTLAICYRKSICRLAVVCDVRAPYSCRWVNFSEIFLHHIVAWPSGNSPTKNHEDRPTKSPQRGVKCEG